MQKTPVYPVIVSMGNDIQDKSGEIISDSPDFTIEVGRALGMGARAGAVFALFGDLGTGKTIIAKGIALGLGIADEITSPTFTMLEIYENTPPLYHFDLYRIDRTEEFGMLGFEEYWYGDGVSVIEWAERAGDLLPPGAVKIQLFHLDENRRRIIIEHPAH